MWHILEHRGLRLIFLANMISMMGSGMNAAAVTWYILQATGSEVRLAELVVLQTLPALLLLPFSGVVIDREDRRRIVMLLDAARAAVILCVTALALMGSVRLWQLYLMNTLVALGFWMFWPSVTALIQELTPGDQFVHSNTMLMAGVQGGWLIAGAIVGFLYNHIGLGGILLIDVLTYAVSFSLYLFVRKGRVVVERPPQEPQPHVPNVEGAVARFFHELREGFKWVMHRPAVVLLGTSWTLFLGGILTQGVVTAPLSERILKGGAVAYGWMNGAWGVGAFLSAMYAARFIRKFGGTVTIALSLAVMSVGLFCTPFSGMVVIAAGFYYMMGSARGLAGIALSSSMMELVPKHLIGRVQNTFYFAGMVLQIVLSLSTGYVAYHWSLTAAFAMIASIYAVGSILPLVPMRREKAAEAA